jgi:Icc-related predicted phosphoesterase
MKERRNLSKSVKLLALSDIEHPIIYNSQIQSRFPDIDLVISCGDLSYYYLEYIISMLDTPLYYVRGNHAPVEEFSSSDSRRDPWGAIDIHRRVVYDQKFGLILAGIEGSLRYNKGLYQYTQGEMWTMVLSMVPNLIFNKIKFGRYLDIFVTHAAPKGIHDEGDRAHQGIQAFKWLIKVFQPRYHLHGHVHLYNPGQVRESKLGETTILNTYGYREILIDSTDP